MKLHLFFPTALIGAVAALLLIASAPVALGQSYFFTFTSGGMDASGTIDILNGVAQSGSIDITGIPIEADPNTLITASGFLLPANGPTDARNHDGDVITYDNVVNPMNDPMLNSNGLGLGFGLYQDTIYYNTVINLYGNSPGSYTLFIGEAQLDGNGNVIGDPQWVYHSDNGSLTLTLVPEPSTVALILGALTVGSSAIRRRRTAV